MNPCSVKETKPTLPWGCTQRIKRRELVFAQGHCEHSRVVKKELGVPSDWREGVSSNLTPGVEVGGNWPPKIEREYGGKSVTTQIAKLSPLTRRISEITPRWYAKMHFI